MAVLKSFELLGNKLSFANWISNLSPKTTPFTSMIGKELIDEVQYSWQTDSLAPASRETFDEGSQAESQKRAATKVFTNFTTILRKAIKVTDTNEATNAYGRRDELAYQMGKAGTEILRDVEYMNLSKHAARKGTKTDASRSAGFKNLCAPLFVPDVDTFAMTHQMIAVKDTRRHWFKIQDVFNITTNLFLSGSKADKIMFHPAHIKVFSDLLGYNEEEPMVYRLFDNLDERYNMSVSKIRDPLGRLYTLVPNRMMPESEVYFFHESDWTQMVLRAPAKSDLGRKGSSKALMLETELGLRHRHPYASGVLSTMVVAYESTLTVDRNIISTIPGDIATFTIALKELDGSPAASVDFNVSISDPTLGELETTAGQTVADGTAKFWMKGLKPGRVVVYVYRYDVDKGLISLPVTVEIVPASVKVIGSEHEMAMGERIDMQATIISPLDHTVVAPAGSEVIWKTNSKDIFFIDEDGNFVPNSISIPTDANLVSKVEIAARLPGEANIWAESNGIKSEEWAVTVVPANLQFTWDATNKDLFTVGVEKGFVLSVTVKDRHGTIVPDTAVIEWSLENGSRGELTPPTATSAGVSTAKFTPTSAGETYVILKAYGDVYKHKITCMNPAVSTSISPSNTMKINDKATLTTFVVDSQGNAVVGKTVHWSSDPTSNIELTPIQAQTTAGGTATTEVKALRYGVTTITPTIDGIDYAPFKVYVGTGAEITLSINPDPVIIGKATNFDVVLVGNDGVALAGEEITFSADSFIGDLSSLTGTTDAGGEHKVLYTPTTSETATIIASATAFDCIATAVMEFAEAEYTYETTDDTDMTIGIGRVRRMEITVRDTAGLMVGGVQLEFTVSDSSKAKMELLNGGKTNGNGQAHITLEPLAKGNISVSVKVKGRSNTQTYHMEIKDPTLTLTATPNPVNFNEWTDVAGVLTDANGNPVNDVMIGFDAVPSAGAEGLTSTTPKTGLDGDYKVPWKMISNSEFEIYAFIHGYQSLQSPIVTVTVNDTP